jgi:hypothetical protein
MSATESATMRVASVPANHVYVQHLSDPRGSDRVHRLADPAPAGAEPGQWWPPAMLEAGWVREHHHEFDVMHVQFGFDALDPAQLSALVRELDRFGKPLVYTAHDLRNPHHADPAAHQRHLDVLIPAAGQVITLTTGAADAIERTWGVRPLVLPHPHVVDFDRMAQPRMPHDGWVVGLHAKSLRASMDPLPVAAALLDEVHDLPGARLQVNIHHDVFDADGLRHDPVLSGWLRGAAAGGQLDLVVHDCFTDDELWDYLQSLDVSVLPYRFGTHSGWLEACYDLGTTVIAPSCGYFAQQRPCLTYQHDERGLDGGSLRAAVRLAYEQRPAWRADVVARTGERIAVAAAHNDVYEAAVR